MIHLLMTTSTVHWGGYSWIGKDGLTQVDLIAASTNSLNGALSPAGPTTTRISRSSGSS